MLAPWPSSGASSSPSSGYDASAATEPEVADGPRTGHGPVSSRASQSTQPNSAEAPALGSRGWPGTSGVVETSPPPTRPEEGEDPQHPAADDSGHEGRAPL